ncbi:MAG: NAD(P)H-dependent oxidoreductase [Desulfovibrio sp.]|nr:NAD(P)H-dependent oxidoreductase [Desulfovibrio sp.]
MSKKLVAYFSASGITARVANNLAKAANADLYEIKPQKPYTQADLNWQDSNSRSSLEMHDPSSRPALLSTDAPIAEHEIIFLGFPIWWYVAPTIINTFLEAYDFSGKTIILFATSGGSGFGKAVDSLQKSAPQANIRQGQVFSANVSENELGQWLNSLGL